MDSYAAAKVATGGPPQPAEVIPEDESEPWWAIKSSSYAPYECFEEDAGRDVIMSSEASLA